MKEMHTLISAYVSSEIAVHAYLANRGDDDGREVERQGCERVAKEIERVAGQTWLPAILITPLGTSKSKWVKEVEAFLRGENNSDVNQTLANYHSKRKNFMCTVWFMETTNEACKRLMAIH